MSCCLPCIRSRRRSNAEIDDRGGIEREQLTQDQPSHNRDTQGPAELIPRARPQRQRQCAQWPPSWSIRMGRKRNMHAQNRVDWLLSLLALSLEERNRSS